MRTKACHVAGIWRLLFIKITGSAINPQQYLVSSMSSSVSVCVYALTPKCNMSGNTMAGFNAQKLSQTSSSVSPPGRHTGTGAR